MAYAVCIGLAVAAVTGLAYGYNYSLAEFLTFSRSDVTVYMKRGQFYDNVDELPYRNFRRSGNHETEDDQLPSNLAIDYENRNVEHHAAPLSDSWRKAQDTRKYAERLVKYNYVPQDLQTFDVVQGEPLPHQPEEFSTPPPMYYKLTTPPFRTTRLISITPNIIMSTILLNSGSSQIIMRKFQPVEEVTPTRTSPKYYGNRDYNNQLGQMHMIENPDYKTIIPLLPKTEYVLVTQIAELKEHLEGVQKRPQKPIQMRHWVPSTASILKDFPHEDTYGASSKPD